MSAPQHITRTGQFRSQVRSVQSLSPRMRRITLTSPEFAGREWPLACDVAVVLTGEDGREVRRRYTVRSADGEDLVLDAVLHGHGPGSSWAASATEGDEVTIFGPRGVIEPVAADWLLALTDEAGLPAIAALAERNRDVDESRTRPMLVLAEIAAPEETYPLADGVELHWVIRGDTAAGGAALLLDALRSRDLPPGRGYAYVLGESRAVVAIRDALADVGLTRAQVYAKGYWNLNSRPTR